MDQTMPNHVAIIMDGNGRWAQLRGLPRTVGHEQGTKRLMKLIEYANSCAIRYLTVYAFSTENWNRPKDEVDFLMKLPFEFLSRFQNNKKYHQIALRFIGKRDGLSVELIQKMDEMEARKISHPTMTVIIAFNYGGRDELIDAFNQAHTHNQRITKDNMNEFLYTKGIPDVDLMIRTSGEYRISNFLLWQCAYSEFYFTPVLWPDFTNKQFDLALQAYFTRHRRYGGLK